MPTKSLKNMLSDSIVSLIVVAQNDEDIIKESLIKIQKSLEILDLKYEILVVDNNSSDKTVENILSENKVISHTRILVLSKRYEKEVAFTAGLDNCIGDFAILFDIQTDPVETIPLLIINKALKGSDIVIGKPSKDIVRHGPMGRLLLSLVGKYSKQDLSYRQNYLTGMNRSVINSIIRTRRKSRNFGYIHSLIGFKKETIYYKPLARSLKNAKKQSFWDLLTSIIDISISNSFRPIRILSAVGLFLSFLYIIYIIVVVILYLFFNQKQLIPKGWVTISTVLGTSFFFLFSLLAIISEYVIRILGESRNEPFYFISEEINKSTILPKKGTLNII